MAGREPSIVCSDLHKRYGRGRLILRGLDLEVPPGVVYALLGTNGAGKTTLIRTVLGLMPRSGGKVRVLGRDPWEAGPSLRQHVGYVSEEQGLYEWMRLEELVRFCRGLYDRWNQDLVDQYLEKFALSTKTKIRTMSRGQKVRLALILALAPEPELLILDEPMSGLDPLAQHEFLRIVQEVAVRQGRTTFFSTHNLADVEAIASYVAILSDGLIKTAGPLAEVCGSIRRIRVRGRRPEEVPPGAVILEAGGDATDYLCPAGTEAGRESAAAGEGIVEVEESPASLREVFIYFCAGGSEG